MEIESSGTQFFSNQQNPLTVGRNAAEPQPKTCRWRHWWTD